jgi:putative flippase GtrA
MLRWFLVGGVTVGIDWLIFVNLYPRIGSVALTNLISGSVSTAFNYLGHHRWTFKSEQHHTQSAVRYGVALFGMYILNTGLVKAFIVLGFVAGAAKLSAAVIQAPVSYFLLNRLVFKGEK